MDHIPLYRIIYSLVIMMMNKLRGGWNSIILLLIHSHLNTSILWTPIPGWNRIDILQKKYYCRLLIQLKLFIFITSCTNYLHYLNLGNTKKILLLYNPLTITTPPQWWVRISTTFNQFHPVLFLKSKHFHSFTESRSSKTWKC